MTTATTTSASEALRDLSNEFWEGFLRANSAAATTLGDRRYDALLDDPSPAGIAAELARLRDTAQDQQVGRARVLERGALRLAEPHAAELRDVVCQRRGKRPALGCDPDRRHCPRLARESTRSVGTLPRRCALLFPRRARLYCAAMRCIGLVLLVTCAWLAGALPARAEDLSKLDLTTMEVAQNVGGAGTVAGDPVIRRIEDRVYVINRTGGNSVTVFDASNPYQSVEIRGTAELIEDPDKELPKLLSHKYLGIEPPDESPKETRLIVRVIPERVVHFSV